MFDSAYLQDRALFVDMIRYLRRHDVVFRSPEYQAYDGIPLGTGCFGGLFYPSPDALHWTVNHTDAVDFTGKTEFGAWSWEDEECTTAPFGCGTLTLTDYQPSYDWKYLEEFENRLNLAEAVHTLHSKTPFSENKVRSYASGVDQVMVLELDMASQQETRRELLLSRWGSRNFFHYYEQIKDVPEKNLGQTSAGEQDGCFYVSQTVGQTAFVTAAKVLDAPHTLQVVNNHSVRCEWDAKTRETCTVLLTTVVSQGTPDVKGAVSQLARAQQRRQQLLPAHREDWKAFWEKGMVHLPQHDYAENVYYINLYQLRSCGRGAYPCMFGGLWTWFGDSRNWGHFYHWNYQQTYWPLHAAGHEELAENYYEYRFSMLDKAMAIGKKLFGVEGAFFSDVTSLDGGQALEPDTVRNFTCGPQIALSFYKHYRYTGDQDFLRRRAYPFMKACALLYENLLEKEDGRYYLRGGATVYEAYWNIKATMTDYAAIQELFAALLEAGRTLDADEDKWELWQDILTHCYPMPEVGYQDGQGARQILSAGFHFDGSPLTWEEGKYPRSTFGPGNISPVYPHGLIGLKDGGSGPFTVAKNTAELILEKSVYIDGLMKVIGHYPIVQTCARLGMEETIDLAERFVDRYQIFKNGLGHFADGKNGEFCPADGYYQLRKIPRGAQRTHWTKVHEKNDGERVRVPADWFNHCYFEATSNIMDGIQEMLLQSYDGTIRVFPAVKPEFEGAFSLCAVGGMRISAHRQKGQVRFVLIESRLGGLCRLECPWQEGMRVTDPDGGNVPLKWEGKTALFDTQPGQTYLAEGLNFAVAQYYKEEIPSYQNGDAKYFGKEQIGNSPNY